MKALALALLLVAACGEKMTPAKCVAAMSRVSACMEAGGDSAIPPASADDEIFGELCKDKDVAAGASQRAECASAAACAAFNACVEKKAPGLGVLGN